MPHPLFTVFTPTYNRAHTIGRVYESLRAQTFRDFEWLVVDDGSKDNTRDVIEGFAREADFPIRYVYKENGGKHTARNLAMKHARGELFLVLDSDDSCVSEALERFAHHWLSIPEERRKDFSGVCALCKTLSGKIVGKKFPADVFESDNHEIVYRYRITGEKWRFHRTAVLREFPFPEPERKVSNYQDGIIWMRIARKYRELYINEALRIYHESEDGLSVVRPKKVAYICMTANLCKLNEDIDYVFLSPLLFLRAAVHYVRFSSHERVRFPDQYRQLKNRKAKMLFALAYLPGRIVFSLDSFRFSVRSKGKLA
jgi:glycosyltransferase involved in cell wall biosynthesis